MSRASPSKSIESNRLASYTEKSTRYQVFERDSFYTPANIAASRYANLYRDTMHLLFDTYFASVDPVRAVILKKYPRQEGENEKKYEGRIRSKWIDNCRYLLPTATLANVGMTANARVLEHAITKMLSHPLEEVRAIGAEMKRVARDRRRPRWSSMPIAANMWPNKCGIRNGGMRNEDASREAVKLVDLRSRRGSEGGGSVSLSRRRT